ncbi:hypothetical protein LCGC14_2018910 [marine sediment metagenome]|uniref:Uncharacterized protein n=1 Tax=marine sediment metagenome TaxID=412755 RepID=A0A0F9HV73_9ZZZZ
MQEDAETGMETTTDAPVVESAPASETVSLDTLKTQLSAAIASGNDPEMMRLSKLVLKNKSDVEKVEANKLLAESAALATDREKLEAIIQKAVKGVIDSATLLKVKAKGFTFTIDHHEDDKGRLDANGPVKVTGGCVLLVPAIRKTGGGGGGGSTGALKQQTGLSRHELIDQYATTTEMADIAAAEEGAATRKDSARYSAEKPVIKRILADNPQLIKR